MAHICQSQKSVGFAEKTVNCVFLVYETIKSTDIDLKKILSFLSSGTFQ